MKKAAIIGAGFAGCTAANLLKDKGWSVTLIEQEGYIGGGCRTFFYHGHPYTYGPHHLLVPVNEMHIWDYMAGFLEMRKLSHYTLTYVSQDNRFYTYPIHHDEIKEMPDSEKIYKELEERGCGKKSGDFEEFWTNMIGRTLYDKFIHIYSEKMWGIDDNRVINDFSFSPKGDTIKSGSRECFEGKMAIGYPAEKDGYNNYFDKCVYGCDLILNMPVDKVDLNKKRVRIKDEWLGADIIVNTASVDMLFDFKYGKLKYIGRDFLKIILPIEHLFPRPYTYLHYAGDEPYTRIVEYKLLTGHKAKDTLIIIETPSFNNKLYPYPIKAEKDKANKYLNELPGDVYSIGRMGKYKYDNMSVVIKDCMELVKKL